MYSKEVFKDLTEKYGKYASWAIWEYSKSRKIERGSEIIFENYEECNAKYVIVGLHISSTIDIWGNFRGGRHDRKLKYAFNNSFVRGAYMTDLFKEVVEVNSSKLYKMISKEKLTESINLFVQEMTDVGVDDESTFVIMGTKNSTTGDFFTNFFSPYFSNKKVIFHRHYSSRGTDKEWVESIWKDLNIDADFEDTVSKYY